MLVLVIAKSYDLGLLAFMVLDHDCLTTKVMSVDTPSASYYWINPSQFRV